MTDISTQRELHPALRPTPSAAGSRSTPEGETQGGAAAPDFAEQRVVRQLVEALLFEGLVEYETSPRAVPDLAAHRAFEAVYDTLVDFEVGSARYRCVAATASFGRVRVAPGSITHGSPGEHEPVRLDELVASLDVPTDARQRLHRELTQTVAFSRWDREHTPHARRPRRGLDFQALESAIVEGHPYHPCFKARTGFSHADHEAYGPEAGATFQLAWLAVQRPLLRSALPSDHASFWTQELGAEAWASLGQRLLAAGGTWGEYALLPVHPWQQQAIAGLGLARAIADRSIIALGLAGDRYRATQSLRTLVNVSSPTKANVKLPLDVVCTSTHRNLREHFVCTAPMLSRWLVELVQGDPFLQRCGHTLLLSEYAGAVHVSEQAGDEHEGEFGLGGLRGRLGVIFRESVVGKLAAGEAAVPFTALTVVESDGRPFVAEWVQEHGVERWADRLLEVMLIPLWHMLVHHGVAFESHAQNLILVHRGGWPEKIVLRDFHEDTEFVLDFLREPHRVPDFAAVDPYFASVPDDDGYRMAEVESLRELFMDTVYVYNLADVAFLLARCFGFGEAHFWNLVRARLHVYEQSGVTAKDRIDRVGCDQAEVVVESLLEKKINAGRVLDFYEHTVPNPLRR